MADTHTYRKATVADLAQCTTLCVIAFSNDELQKALHPVDLRIEYPEGVWEQWEAKTYLHLLSPTTTVLVVEKEGTIIAMISWTRKLGAAEPKEIIHNWRVNRDSLLQRLERGVFSWQRTLSGWVKPTGTDRKVLKQISSIRASVDHEFFSKPPTDVRWQLDTLAVLPDHQKQGIGKMLIQWGLKRADEEGVICTAEANLPGMSLYEKFGFVGLKKVELIVDEAKNVKLDCPFMIRYPEGTDFKRFPVVDLRS